MFCFAVTGGIGSGKSYLVRLMSSLGLPAYIADYRAKELYKTNRTLVNNLANLLGKEILSDDGIRKDIMAAKIFSNPDLLEQVNSIVHPEVLNDFYQWRGLMKSEGYDTVIYESAIFLETPRFHRIADKVIVVVAPEDERVRRVIKRDSLSEVSVRERMSRQWSDEKRLKMADFVIFADGKRAILPQVMEILNQTGIKPEI
ncbi:MAG: dephospho-CoA kinase [Bacteroidales bacterium]|jgi:dephospho-CoA kinase|nr:dephospho-CoA kinase [Bacteroidales bacterium]MDD3273313.1 dephospho-CoA kinase [Bacteroidales bacterium]MDD4057441.1 dephospho-CoA kinase [Bacteroidales bacterium]